jgi:hypothetical protein
MSAKSTIRITRERALEVLLSELPVLGNGVLEKCMDVLADSGQSRNCSTLDNFVVSSF